MGQLRTALRIDRSRLFRDMLSAHCLLVCAARTHGSRRQVHFSRTWQELDSCLSNWRGAEYSCRSHELQNYARPVTLLSAAWSSSSINRSMSPNSWADWHKVWHLRYGTKGTKSRSSRGRTGKAAAWVHEAWFECFPLEHHGISRCLSGPAREAVDSFGHEAETSCSMMSQAGWKSTLRHKKKHAKEACRWCCSCGQHGCLA